MGPTNDALVRLFRADQSLREAQGRLDAVSKGVRIQERKTADLSERLRLAQAKLKEQQSLAGQFDLDVKTRDAHIEKLRSQQQNAKTNKEYQVFLAEINTEKVDKTKYEDQLLATMEEVEKFQAEQKELTAALQAEQTTLQQMRGAIGERVAQLQKEIDALMPQRQAAAEATPPKALEAFERLAERWDGEALSALTRPNRRREEYACSACNMDLVTDVYNKLHARDELIFCPSCRRILYIPEDLPVEAAVNKVKDKPKTRSEKGASTPRQSAAEDVLKSVTVEEEPSEHGTGKTA